jgi:F-type H+-transporting ATPase subunit b
MELLSKLGIDWKLLIAQIINFLVLMAVLYKFLYKPVLKVLDDRKEKIDKSLKQAEKIEKNLFKSEADRSKAMQEARNEAGKIISEAKKMSEKLKEELLNKTRLESTAIVEQGRRELASEKDAMFKEIKGEVADMVKTAMEKIMRGEMTEKLDKKIIEKSLEEI